MAARGKNEHANEDDQPWVPPAHLTASAQGYSSGGAASTSGGWVPPGEEAATTPTAGDVGGSLDAKADAITAGNDISRAGAAPPIPRAKSSIGAQLLNTGRHPVLLFGARQTGKSTFLMSLVQRINRSEVARITQGDPVLPPGHPMAATVNDAVRNFMGRDVHAFRQGNPVPRTELEYAWFVPLDVERCDGGGVMRFAFLEGKGEFYETNEEDRNANYYKQLHDNVADVLTTYPESISVIYVAPYFGTNADERESARRNDEGLTGALDAYDRLRRARDQDHHLFLLTKWDCCANPMDPTSSFSQLTEEEVEQQLRRLYPSAWPQFCGLPGVRNRRSFMQYSSGYIVNETVQPPAERHRDAFDRYPATIWNWLGQNAANSGANAQDDVTGWHRPLFPEVRRGGGLMELLRRLTGRR